MKDVEIRGAGNLLGAEQSGHIEGVGFDLYIRMVGEAVAGFRGEGEQERAAVTIDLPIEAHIPTGYIEHERLRLEAYRKIADADTAVDLQAVAEELDDRYGAIPEPVSNLFAVARVRLDLRAAGVTDVVAQGKYIRFGPLELLDSAAVRMNRLYPGTVIKPAIRQVLVPAPTTTRIGGAPLEGVPLLEWVKEVLKSAQGTPVG